MNLLKNIIKIKFDLLEKHKLVIFITIVLAVVPFFWLKPGELELGGDSSRLYLYDPGSYLQFTSLYSVDPSGMGKLIPNQNMLPFLLLLQLFYNIFHSSYILIYLLNSLKLSGSFFFMYLIIAEILKKHGEKDKIFLIDVAGILTGLFYTFSSSVGENIHAALLTHNQVFLNPMIFYLILRFFITHQSKYIWFTLLITLIFSPNFTLLAPPAPFSFYPLAFFFIALYTSIVLKKSLPWKKLLFGLFLFVGIHSFHIIPDVTHIFDQGSAFNERAFGTGTARNEGLEYFNAVLGLGKVSLNIFSTYSTHQVRWTTFAVPLVIILGFILCKKRQSDLFLISAFFFITLFLASANITHIGVEFYRRLFYIPGFSMFRVFYGQWQWVYTFFYALLFGYSLFIVFLRVKRKYIFILSGFLISLFIFNSWIFISGQILRRIHWGSNNMTSIIKMDPNYEKTLAFLKTIPNDGKIFNFPFTDFSYQVIPGVNNGAYIGTSPTAYLSGKKDFSGYSDIAPFSNIFLKLAKEKNYVAIKRLFGILSVKYIFHIAGPKAYEVSFPTFPYSLFHDAISDSNSLTDFVDKVTDGKVFQQGNYFVYYADKTSYLPHFYIPTTLLAYDNDKDDWYGKNASFFVDNIVSDPRVGYIYRDTCVKLFSSLDCKQNIKKENVPSIIYKRVNPIKYRVEVSGVTGPFVLVFSDQFHKDWKVYVSKKEHKKEKIQRGYFNGSIQEYRHEDIFFNDSTFETLDMKSISENRHFTMNGYANAWYIMPTDFSGNEKNEIIIEMVGQRIFYYSLAITFVSIFIFILYGIKLLKR